MSTFNSNAPLVTPTKPVGLCVFMTGTDSAHSPSEGLLLYPDLDFHRISSGSKARSEILSFYIIL